MNQKFLSLLTQFWQGKRSSRSSIKMPNQVQLLLKKANSLRKSLSQLQVYRYHPRVRLPLYFFAGLLIFTLFACYVTTGEMSETSYKTSWLGNTFGGG